MVRSSQIVGIVLCAVAGTVAQAQVQLDGLTQELSQQPGGLTRQPGAILLPQPPAEITIDVPDLIVRGQPTHADITIDVPGLVVRGRPTHAEIVIDVPDLRIIGETTHAEIVLDIPDLIIVGETTHPEIVIDVPGLVVIGAGEDQDEDQQRLEGTVIRGERTPPDTPGTPAPPPQTEQDAALVDWCHGSYGGHFGRGLGTGLGVTMPVGQNLQAPAEVTWTSCTSLEVAVQGQPVAMTQIPGTRTYAGPINMGDGVARTLRLSCDADFNMRGSLVAADANISIERPVWLIRAPGQQAALPPCNEAITDSEQD